MNKESTFDTEALKKRLARLNEDAGVRTTLLITKEGDCIAFAGDISYLDITGLAALIAGMFSATREVARLIGEDQFSILLQQGEKRHIHISLVNNVGMMVMIFEDYQKIGKVRHKARKAATEIAQILLTERIEGEKKISVEKFKEYALNLIDRIFEKK